MKNDMENMWNRFDKIVCIHYLLFKEQRFENCKSELERVGILNLPQFEWEFTVPNKFYEYIKFPDKKGSGAKKFSLQYTFHYYTLLKKLQYLGYNNVLILEDDIAFRKDLKEIRTLLEATPEDYDIMNYEPFRRKGWKGNGKGCWGKYYDLNGNLVNQNWCEELVMRYNSIIYDTGMIAFSKRCIDHIVNRLETEAAKTIDCYTWGENGEMNGYNTYCTTGANYVGIQNKDVYTNKISSDKDVNTIHHCYEVTADFDKRKFNVIKNQAIDDEIDDDGDATYKLF